MQIIALQGGFCGYYNTVPHSICLNHGLPFLFVPLTLGLSVLVAIMETNYLRKKDEVYKKMAKFWGNLFIINFRIGGW